MDSGGGSPRLHTDLDAGLLRVTMHRTTGYQERPVRAWVSQLRKGLIELCVMGALRQGESYGYALLQRLSDLEGMAVTESTVYPILARLAQEGLVAVRTAASSTGPPRRYYRLTGVGRERFEEMALYWKGLRSTVDSLVLSPPRRPQRPEEEQA